MSDQTIITMSDGTNWKPSTSSDIVHCDSCGSAVITPQNSSCPECNQNWTGAERRSTSITVTAPEAVKGVA